jgi:[protein-PII] uridylyltransferase
LSFHDQSAVAQLQGFESDDALLRHVSLAGRAIAQASDQAWNRIERQTTRRGIRRLEPRRDRYPLADGVVVQNGEVVLAREADPSSDATLLLRTAGAAAQAGLPLAPHTIERLAEQTPPIQVPWPSSAQNAFVSLLGSGPALLPVWEALDQAGIFSRLLPHWERIRSAPQRNALHQYTVDRHCVETVVQASALTREVSRPDLLLVGALFHDIGKAQGKGHSEIGETLIRQIAPTLGFSVGLVLYHLLLAETATTRDLEDPATIEMVAAAVGNLEVLQLLRQLTEADSKATNDGIWTDWKARLVNTLCEKVEMQLTGEKFEPVDSFVKRSGMLNLEPGEIHISRDSAGFVVRLCAIDRVGLVANVAGIWALEKLEVISADFDTIGGVAYQEWLLRPVFGDPVSEQELIQQVQRGLSAPDSIAEAVTRLVPARQSRRGYAVPPMRFKVEHLGDATVVEVRAHDTAGMLYKICTQIAAKKLNIRNARIATLGSEVVDAIYLQNAAGARLADYEVADLEVAIREALQNSES